MITKVRFCLDNHYSIKLKPLLCPFSLALVADMVTHVEVHHLASRDMRRHQLYHRLPTCCGDRHCHRAHTNILTTHQ